MSDSTLIVVIIFLTTTFVLSILIAFLVAREQKETHWEDMIEEAKQRLDLEEHRFRGIDNKNLEQ